MAATSQFKKQWYFEYQPLDKSQDSFRILKILPAANSAPIECALSRERISEMDDRYSALSYTWGKRAIERWIRVNGKPFMVQPSLFEALRAIRSQDEEILLWADAICINQSDTAERNHQVGLMGKVYSSAKNVRVWLGPAADDSDLVLDYLERMEDTVQRQRTGETLDSPPDSETLVFLEAFRALHRRPYWSRAWIKQEVILAKELIIHCGSKSANGLRLLIEAHWHCYWPWGIGGCNALPDDIANLSVHRLKREDGIREPLEVLLKRYGRTGCADVRDRVFSILSLAADCEGLEGRLVDYSISLPALFFAVLAFIKPRNVLSLATTLHEILGVRRADMLEYWDKIEGPAELSADMRGPVGDSPLENIGLSTIWGVKATKKIVQELHTAWPEYADCLKSASEDEFPEICGVMGLQPFLVRCGQLLDLSLQGMHQGQRPLENGRGGNLSGESQNQVEHRGGAKMDDYALYQISSTNYFVLARKTIFGGRFVYAFSRDEETSANSGHTVMEPVLPAVSEQLKPFMIYPRIVLEKSGEALLDPFDFSLILDKWTLEGTFGRVVLEPPVDIMCRILLELDQQSGDKGICTNECKYVLEACGYELKELGRPLAEFRILAEHDNRRAERGRLRRLREAQRQEGQ